MHIANPIYDVVFKFMMEDEKSAKSFLSAIIGEEVLELDFASRERTVRRPVGKKKEQRREKDEDGGLCLTVCRYDFSARIALPGGGFKTVLIELQKAKLASDIMRFRRYLGRNYQDEDNVYGEENDRKARQIYCIFLLGYDVCIPGRTVIEVDYTAKDVTTNEELTAANEFIQSLHHRSWIIQIEQLKQRRRNDLEKLLSIFDQANRTKSHYILNVDEDDFPEQYRPIIRRLRMACESEDIQIEMEMEDDYLSELQEKERLIEEHREELKEHKKEIKEHRKTLKEKDKIIKELKKQLLTANSSKK
ncbi:MAG: hypothetical protein LBF08_03795 [Dysgonamonadaceae bacterium]|jgi:Mg2+ and Co2+ transporter CorA|nr:hypothetical protein [Dysgonamonadaceae bacterium]